MDWDNLGLRDNVLAWLEAASAEYRVKEVKLDPYATSMRNFDDVSPHLRAIRSGGVPSSSDPSQRITDLRGAGLVDAAGTGLTDLGTAVFGSWEHFGVDTDDLGDELARTLLMVLEGRRLQSPPIVHFLDHWNEVRTYFDPIALISSWATLFHLSYLDFDREGFRPGSVLRDEGVSADDVYFDLGDFARDLGASAAAIEGAEKIESAIAAKLPRGRDRATFCMALEIVLSGGNSAEQVLADFGIPKPHKWIGFTQTQKTKIREILGAYGAHAAAGSATVPIPAQAQSEAPGEPILNPSPPPELPPEIDFEQVLVEHPKPTKKTTSGASKSGAKKVDHQKKAKKQDEVGKLGEEFVLQYERWRLREHTDLQKKIRHVSKDDDALGYDIASYELDGSERLVEVKATLGPLESRFFLSINEYRCAENNPGTYVIVRAARLDTKPVCCEIRFPFTELDLSTDVFSAHFKSEE